MCYSVQGSCYHYFSVRGLRLRQACPFMVAFSRRPSPAPLQISLVLQLCWLGLWGFLCPCPSPSGPSGQAWRRRHWEERGISFSYSLIWKFYLRGWGGAVSFPQCDGSKQVDIKRWHNRVILKSDIYSIFLEKPSPILNPVESWTVTSKFRKPPHWPSQTSVFLSVEWGSCG